MSTVAEFQELPTPRVELRFTAPTHAAEQRTPMGTVVAPPPTHDPGPEPLEVESEQQRAARLEAGGEPATRMALVDGEVRYRVIVEAIKIPEGQRTTIRRILPDQAAVAARGYLDILGSDTPDDDPEFPAGGLDVLDGVRVHYSLMVTEAERVELDAHPNVIGARRAPMVHPL